MIGTLIAVVSVLLAVPGVLTVSHLGVLAIGSLLYRERLPTTDVPPVRFLIAVPAHNEELVLAHTLIALTADMRPDDLLLVVDDRSTDRTASIAQSFGATVVRRSPESTPGRAAARQAAIEASRSMDWDAMVMIDADSIIEPGFFDAAERMMATGAVAIQARSEAALGRRLVDQAALASFAMQGVLIPRGRDRLGFLVRLRGTGMVLHRSLIERFTFRAPASEDLVYSLDLCRAGIPIRHLDSARLRSQNAGSWKTAANQKLRYETGRKSAGREQVVPLLRGAGRSGLEAAWFLLSPPFATAASWLVAALAVSLLGAPQWLSWVVAVLVLALGLELLLGLAQARVSPRIVGAMILAPAYLGWKLIVQANAAVAVRRGAREFGATERHRSDHATQGQRG